MAGEAEGNVTTLREALPIEDYESAVDRILRRRGRLEDAKVKELLTEMASVRRDLISELRNIPISDKTWRAEQIRILKSQIEIAGNRLASRYGVMLNVAIDDAWELGAGFMPATLTSIGVDVSITAISTVQLEVSKQLTGDLIKSVTQDFVSKAEKEITLGVMGARNPYEITKRIEGLLLTQGREGFGPIANQAERIVRTEINRTFSVANHIRTEEIDKDVKGLRHYWLATISGRTRPEHVSAGRRYAPGGRPGPIPIRDSFVVGGEKMRFPHDPNASAGNVIGCRCVDVLYSKEWF